VKKRKITKRCTKPADNVEATLNNNVGDRVDNHNVEIRKRMKLTQKELAGKLGVSLKQVKLLELERRPTFKGDTPYKEGVQPFMLRYVDTSVEDAISEALKHIDDPDKKKDFEDRILKMRNSESDNNKEIVLNDPTDLLKIEKEGMCSTAKAMPTLDYLKKKDMCYDCETREDLIRFIQEMGWHSDSFYYYVGAKQINIPIGGVDELFYDGLQLDNNSKELFKAIKLLRDKLSRTIDEVSREDDPRFKYILAKRMFELGREYQKAESVKYKKITKAGADRIKGRHNVWNGKRKKNEWTKLSAAGHDNKEVLAFLVAEYRKEEIDNPRYVGIYSSVMLDAKRKFKSSEKSNMLEKEYSRKRILKEISRLKILECKKDKTAIKK
jgi:hypothetical protein